MAALTSLFAVTDPYLTDPYLVYGGSISISVIVIIIIIIM